MYVSHRQFPSSFMHLIVRTGVPPEMLSASIQREINALDPDQPVSNVRTMDQAISEAVPRFDVSVLALFAGMAWLLATIGVYGVTSYGVAQRTRDCAQRGLSIRSARPSPAAKRASAAARRARSRVNIPASLRRIASATPGSGWPSYSEWMFQP